MLFQSSRRSATLAVVALAWASSHAAAQTADKFYEGKTLRIVVALGTGGDYDNYARLAGRWLGKHIPGNPTVVVQNMPGAGGLTAANYIHNVAPKDGTVLGALHQNTTLAQVTGAPNVDYDVRKFAWIGRTSTGGLNVHHTWAASGVSKFDDLMTRQVIVGAGGPTSDSTVLPSAVNSLIGTKLKILGGYSGTNETTIALERGEIEMAMQNWEFLRARNADWLRDKKIHLIVQYGLERHPELPNVPSIMEMAKTDEQKQVLKLFLQSGAIGYSLVLTPDVPAERIALVRAAFDKMLKDPGLIAESERMSLPLEPLSGDMLTKTIDSMFRIDASAIEKAKSILGR